MDSDRLYKVIAIDTIMINRSWMKLAEINGLQLPRIRSLLRLSQNAASKSPEKAKTGRAQRSLESEKRRIGEKTVDQRKVYF